MYIVLITHYWPSALRLRLEELLVTIFYIYVFKATNNISLLKLRRAVSQMARQVHGMRKLGYS